MKKKIRRTSITPTHKNHPISPVKKNEFNPFTGFFLSLCGIALINFVLSIIRIDRVPPGISTDVLLYFSNARTIAETGKDIYGHLLPLFFSHKGYLVNPVTVYITAFVYKILGFNTINGYLPNILISAFGVSIIGLFASCVTNNKRIGILAAIALTISPWHYHLSRTGFEGVFGFTVVFIGIYCSILGLTKQRYLLISLIMFLIASFSYKAINIFLIVYPFIFAIKAGLSFVKTKQFILYTFGIWVIIFIQWFLLFTFYHDTYANGIISKNIDQAKTLVSEEMNQSDAPRFMKRIMSNTPVAMGSILMKNYVNFFSPQYLFVTGDTDNRFSTTGWGQLYYIDFFFIIAGFIWLRSHDRSRNLPFLAAIILAAPISSLISDEQYAIRTFIVVFMFSTLIAMGIESIITMKMNDRIRKSVLLGIACIYTFSFLLYLYRYHFIYIQIGRLSWGGTNRQVFMEAYQLRKQYEKITFGRSSEFQFLEFMYWNRLPVPDIQRAFSTYNEKELTFGNFSFVRSCTRTGDDLDSTAIHPDEIVYVPEDCFNQAEPKTRYYLPKLLISSWKSYDYTAYLNYQKKLDQLDPHRITSSSD